MSNKNYSWGKEEEEIDRFPDWKEGAYYLIGNPEFSLELDKVYVLKEGNTVQIIKITDLEKTDNKNPKISAVSFTVFKTYRRPNWENDFTLDHTNSVYLRKEYIQGVSENQLQKWNKPRFYYPAYLKDSSDPKKPAYFNSGGTRKLRKQKNRIRRVYSKKVKHRTVV